MKVEFCQEVTVTGSASVSIEQISDALSDALKSVEYVMEHSDNGRTKAYVVTRFANDCFQCLSAITDEMIEEVSDENRELIYEGLKKASDKWLSRKCASST